jgi:hypothetical protein
MNPGKQNQSGVVTAWVIGGDRYLYNDKGSGLANYKVLQTSRGIIFVETSRSLGRARQENFLVDNWHLDMRDSLEYWATSEDRASKAIRNTFEISESLGSPLF